MIGYLMKKVDGRIINSLMSEVQGMLKTITLTFSKDILESYKLDSENRIAAAMKSNQDYVNEEVVQLRKRYVFHDNKTFWTHLIDWYAFNKQEKNRERIQQSVQAAAEKKIHQSSLGRQ